MNEVKFGTWTVPESPVNIQYSLVVIEEIRHVVAQGFQKMARGGIEVGGILYGRRDGHSIHILAMRPIKCEHALGPSFQLSVKDRAALEQQMVEDQADPHLEGMISVGVFISHTRSEIALSQADLDLYNAYFEAPWQVAMVIRPGRAGAMRAGFFVRESDGAIRCESCYLEFNFPDRLAGVLDRPKPERPPLERSERRSSYRGDSGAATAPGLNPDSPPNALVLSREPSFALLDAALPAGEKKSKWPWLVVWAVVLIGVVVVGLRYFVLRPDAEPISLSVLERDGQLQIGWNHSARPVATAIRGTVDIVDGGDSKHISLTAPDLQRGNLTYQRRSGDVEVRLVVEDQGGTKTQEASRFLGRPPEKQDAPAVKELETKRDDMQEENARLRRANAEQAQRIQQLERIVKIMQSRQGDAK